MFEGDVSVDLRRRMHLTRFAAYAKAGQGAEKIDTLLQSLKSESALVDSVHLSKMADVWKREVGMLISVVVLNPPGTVTRGL